MNDKHLSQFTKVFPFVEPEGFFEKNKNHILDKTIRNKQKPDSLIPRSFYPYFAAAAVIAIVLIIRLTSSEQLSNGSTAMLDYVSQTYDVFSPDELSFLEMTTDESEFWSEYENSTTTNQPSEEVIIEYLLQNESLF